MTALQYCRYCKIYKKQKVSMEQHVSQAEEYAEIKTVQSTIIQDELCDNSWTTSSEDTP